MDMTYPVFFGLDVSDWRQPMLGYATTLMLADADGSLELRHRPLFTADLKR
jgi:hypothetical protein